MILHFTINYYNILHTNLDNNAEYKNGKTVVISAWTVVCFAFCVTLPHEIASRTKAPLKLPSNSCAVVMYTAKSKPSL